MAVTQSFVNINVGEMFFQRFLRDLCMNHVYKDPFFLIGFDNVYSAKYLIGKRWRSRDEKN
jgi:hypothetical protein